MAKARFGAKAVASAPMMEGDAMPADVGHKMVKAGKAAHPHWRSGRRQAHAKRMYGNAATAHAHTKIRP